jgi:hypothetical protein
MFEFQFEQSALILPCLVVLIHISSINYEVGSKEHVHSCIYGFNWDTGIIELGKYLIQERAIYLCWILLLHH